MGLPASDHQKLCLTLAMPDVARGDAHSNLRGGHCTASAMSLRRALR